MKNEEKNDIVIIELDRPRELRLTHKVLKRFLARTKIKMEHFDEAVSDYTNMTKLVYEMLYREDPELTEDRCDELLDEVPITVILTKGAQAIAAGFGEAEDGGAEKEENPTMSR